MASRRDQRASSRGGNGCPSLSLVATALEEEAGWSLESVIVEVEEGRKKLRRSLGWLMRSVMVLRRLGSIFTSVYAAVHKLKKDSWKELQFSLVDNSKLNAVYLLNRS
ncbi:hypothetical protein Tco_0212807 [Tanacetum coccineum]